MTNTDKTVSTERLRTELDRAQAGHRNMFSGAELVLLLTELLASRTSGQGSNEDD